VAYLFLFRISSESYSLVHSVGLWIGSLQGFRLWRKHKPIATHLFLIYLLSISLFCLLFTSSCPSHSFFLYFFFAIFVFKLSLLIYLYVISCPICICFFFPFV